MYRLHNLGIEAKIDWLVVNGYLTQKKIIICPYGNYGMKIKQYVNQRYGIQEYAIVDKELWKYNPNVRSMEFLEEIARAGENYAILTGDVRVDELLKEFSSLGIDESKCYLLKGEPLTAQDALLKVAGDETIDSVLDVGCGKGNHAKILAAFGKKVTGIDSGFTCEIKEPKEYKIIVDDFLSHNFEETYDCVWCAHVLEHQMAVGLFLKKLFDCCKEGGKAAITVPLGTGIIVEGHVTLWNAGLLMYNIVQAGYSCRRAAVKTYADNVSVIVPKERICREEDYRSVYDSRKYFPANLDCGRSRFGGICFDGNISELNW